MRTQLWHPSPSQSVSQSAIAIQSESATNYGDGGEQCELINQVRNQLSFNGTHSVQLFVVEFDTCLVWELLLLPSNAQTAPDLPSLKAPDGDTREA